MKRKNEKVPESDRPVNKATMDQPQEEFVADQSVPSYNDAAFDREHGDEIGRPPADEPRPSKS